MKLSSKRRKAALRLPVICVLGLALTAAYAVGVRAEVVSPESPREPLREPPQPAVQISAEAAAQTDKKAVWGPISHDGVSMFPTYRDLGAGIYQTQAHWDEIAPTRPVNPSNPDDPAYEWPGYLERAVSEAERYEMKVQIMIIGAPGWANGYRSWKWAPYEPSDFGEFASAIARRFPSVHQWMIWGEPNRKPNFGPLTPSSGKGRLTNAQSRAPRLYAQMLDSAYAQLKGVSAQNLVIGGNTFTASGRESIRTHQWIRHLRLPGGSPPRMDMWGHNPFTFRKPNLNSRPSPRGQVDFSDLRRLARALDRAGFPNAPLKLYLSEWGVPIGFRDKDLLFKVRPAVGVKWIQAAFRIVRRWDRVYTLGWIHPIDTERSSQGLLDSDGNRKPGYDAFKAG